MKNTAQEKYESWIGDMMLGDRKAYLDLFKTPIQTESDLEKVLSIVDDRLSGDLGWYLFSSSGLQKRIFYQSPVIEIAGICWMPGQESSIHRHNTHTLSGFRVIQGSLTHRGYIESSTGQPLLYSEEILKQKQWGFIWHQDIHSLHNNSQTVASSLHIQSPPNGKAKEWT